MEGVAHGDAGYVGADQRAVRKEMKTIVRMAVCVAVLVNGARAENTTAQTGPRGLSPVVEAYKENACADPKLTPMPDAYEAYVASDKARQAGDRSLAERYAACAVQLGGSTAMFNLGGRLREIGDPRALDYLLASALLGNRRAQEMAGIMLLKQASSERQRLIALNMLATATEGCEWEGGAALVEYAEKSVYPPALIAAHVRLKKHLDGLRNSGGNVTYFSGWLRSLEKLMTPTMLRHSEAAEASFSGHACAEYRKRAPKGG
ncbi:MAG: hypothetical protein AMXMBFR59_04640 [Rhodanobacteraceae bacterium]